MPKLRPYANEDWKAALELCLLAFAPACESLERVMAADLDWKTALQRHLRTVTRSGRTVVAELRGSLVGLVHYQVDPDSQSGSIDVSAVHPAHQRRGIGSQLYRHALDAMRDQGARYATAETGDDPSHQAARRAYEKVGFVALPMVHYFISLAGPGPVSRPGSGARRKASATSRPSARSASRQRRAGASSARRASR